MCASVKLTRVYVSFDRNRGREGVGQVINLFD